MPMLPSRSVRARCLPPSGSFFRLAETAMRSPPLILVADDNAANVDIVRARLSANGYSIISAVDGVDALASAQDNLPDLILLDIMMPKLDGVEVTRRLKSSAAAPFM